jgi:hypothetical protein
MVHTIVDTTPGQKTVKVIETVTVKEHIPEGVKPTPTITEVHVEPVTVPREVAPLPEITLAPVPTPTPAPTPM